MEEMKNVEVRCMFQVCGVRNRNLVKPKFYLLLEGFVPKLSIIFSNKLSHTILSIIRISSRICQQSMWNLIKRNEFQYNLEGFWMQEWQPGQ
jgi:hypothetical protein